MANLTLEYFEGLAEVEAKYRAGKAEQIRQADRVVLYIVDFDFDNMQPANAFSNEAELLLVAPYDKQTRILATKELEPDDYANLLSVFSEQVAVPDQSSGAMCHFPIHGIRIYLGDELLHEGTFCWACGNFSFSYPVSAGWLSTNAELKEIFFRLMPIPEEEIERFQEFMPAK